MAEQSEIRNFYNGKNIFITGATGFVGVTLIEKILRDIPNVGTLYLLMRPKKKKSIEDRLQDLTKSSVFEKYLETKTPKDILSKIVAIQGDVGEDNLGIADKDLQTLIDNVNVVFHSAATLDFFQSLKETTNINLQGTRRVMELCKQLQHLEAVVHVSSAYVNAYLLEADEILYPSPEDPEKVIEVSALPEEALKGLEPKLMKDHPNTYTFTKHLAEHEVNKCASIFPCGIVRPSMITAAWKEPVPGWTISKNGPQGFFMGASKGVIRRLPLDPSLVMDYIPVDIVVNQILVTGQYVNNLKIKNEGKPDELQIFHCTSSTYRPFRFETLTAQINGYMHKYPLKSAAWYPHLKFVKSLFFFRIAAIFFHFLPGYILDFVTKVSGGRPILVRLHTNVWNSLNTLEKFIFTEWKYNNKKTLQVAKKQNSADKQAFNIDIGELKWEEYFLNMLLGVRQYLNKETLKNIEAARSKDKILLGLHVALQLAFYFGVWQLFICIFGITSAKAALILPIFYLLFSYL